jgi:hypothetical protein
MKNICNVFDSELNKNDIDSIFDSLNNKNKHYKSNTSFRFSFNSCVNIIHFKKNGKNLRFFMKKCSTKK